jgi:glycosyltransferase involved in cell wall biosynthesis
MTPLVSILVPAYNAERWIADTIRSAVGQTWRRTEIIVVDDGSRDRTLEVAQQFASSAVRVVTQENQGASAARNKAYQLCQGDYIQWLDADDLLATDKISKQMEVLSQCGGARTLLSGPWGSFFYRTSRAKFRPGPLWHDLSPVEWFIKECSYNAHMQTATWLISRELSENAGPWDNRLGSNDDGEYLCRIIKQSDVIKFVPDAKVFYRITGSARLSNVGRSQEKAKARLLGIRLQINHVLSLENSERTRSACMQKLRTWSSNFYIEGDPLTTEAKEIAESLGQVLTPKKMSWKYAWIQDIWGPEAARALRLSYNKAKCSVMQWWDALLFSIEKHAGTHN